MSKIIALGSDHGGFELKEYIKKYLTENNIKCIDVGTDSTSSVDYPVYAFKVAEEIVNKKADLGILCCGTGIGISIAANKVKGIRAAVCESEFCTEMCRRHNDANILCLGGRVINGELAKKLVEIFITTPFEGGRHKNRINQITQIENNKFKL